jgi:hypothetical protein
MPHNLVGFVQPVDRDELTPAGAEMFKLLAAQQRALLHRRRRWY